MSKSKRRKPKKWLQLKTFTEHDHSNNNNKKSVGMNDSLIYWHNHSQSQKWIIKMCAKSYLTIKT